MQLDLAPSINGGYGAGNAAGYAKGSDTSLEGALHAEKTLSERQTLVLGYVRRPQGVTCGEIAHATGMGMNVLSGRLDELEQLGLIFRTSARRPSPVSGRNGIVWCITKAGRAHVERAA